MLTEMTVILFINVIKHIINEIKGFSISPEGR